MGRINKIQQMAGDKTNTYEGGVAYHLSFKERLAEFFSLGLLNGNFYQSEEQVLKNAKDLFERALGECPEFATKAAIYGNHVNSLKLVPTIWLVYLSTLDDKHLFKTAFPRIIRNPKMLHDFMEIARKGGIRQGLGRNTKKVMNEWLINHLNEYQVSRNKGKLENIIKVTRPYSQDETFQNYMKYISKGELTFPRAAALKEVINFMEKGELNETTFVLIENNRLQLEELKHATQNLTKEDKGKLYEVMYKGLNYTALMLNLVALERVYATRTHVEVKCIHKDGQFQQLKQTIVDETDIPPYVLDMIAARIRDVELYRKSNMLPFALLNAEKMVTTPEFKRAIGDMLRNVAHDVFKIDESIDLLVGVDTSASMSGCMVTDTGSLSAMDIASIFGAMIKKSHAKTNVHAVASRIQQVNLAKQDDVFDMARQIEQAQVGYGTYFEQLMQVYHGEKYVILLTDNNAADQLEKRWLEAKKPAGAKLIVWQLVPYGIKISKNPSIVQIAGYSDRILGLVKNIIEGKSGQVEEVEKMNIFTNEQAKAEMVKPAA
ncbi:60 kDa SS-A/Ro ribonucleoprotein [Paenibacillus sp. 1182]|uniref:RNA-binding protein n=1 Tax=Paenibacillus sp. 1182 TaxID=2806565 RepID=UPI001AE209D1|nr:RNA-binding protein [Paenibacillus sp. 1182]MBP1308817.1 60 kDa SS-A/Ro ribonucleoprotein [Paenibacillus sp. 1182]